VSNKRLRAFRLPQISAGVWVLVNLVFCCHCSGSGGLFPTELFSMRHNPPVVVFSGIGGCALVGSRYLRARTCPGTTPQSGPSPTGQCPAGSQGSPAAGACFVLPLGIQQRPACHICRSSHFLRRHFCFGVEMSGHCAPGHCFAKAGFRSTT